MLSNVISVERRYQRSINIEQDFGNIEALSGYVFPQSAKQTVLSMAEQIRKTGQGSFTWTGPYGSGKSSLAIALAALLTGTKNTRTQAAKLLEIDWAETLWETIVPEKAGMMFIPVVGTNSPVFETVGAALKSQKLMGKTASLRSPSVLKVISKLCESTESKKIVLFIDEMGKTLEHAVKSDGDVYFYQELAELANRSRGRFVIVGVLHQAFQEYASILSRRSRDEWAKIQGRFVDLAVDIRADEQITLISKAVHSNSECSDDFKIMAKATAEIVERSRKGFKTSMSGTLTGAWPLHPIIACLLGPMSRKGSGQNYRSVFSFLNSAEPQGFQDFICHNEIGDIFGIQHLWPYIMLNLKGAVLASSDGHKWAVAIEAVDKADAIGLSELSIDCLKAISILDWLKDGSGIGSSFEGVSLLFSEAPREKVRAALDILQEQALITYRRYNDTYALFEGSDFNIEQAILEIKNESGVSGISNASDFIELPTVIAKRHYHATGTLRWGNFVITPASKLIDEVSQYGETGTGISLCAIVIIEQEGNDSHSKVISEAHNISKSFELLTAPISISDEMHALFTDIDSLNHILTKRTELAGDRVARREIRERLLHMTDVAKDRLYAALDGLTFKSGGGKTYAYPWQEIGRIVDRIASSRYHSAPMINNELLNREKPSSTANLALKRLLYALLYNVGEEHLGFKGFPAERGLLDSLLVAAGLYQRGSDDEWKLAEPDKASPKLENLWNITVKYLSASDSGVFSLEGLYRLWMAPPYGLSKGVCPFYAAIFIFTKWNDLAFYRQGLFRSKLSEVDIDVLMKSPELIDLRWMQVTDETKALLSSLTDLALQYHNAEDLVHSETIDVAKALIAAFDKLPLFTGRTQLLSKNARSVRTLFKSAHDPNKFIFEDIPSLKRFTQGEADQSDAIKIANNLGAGLDELFEAYPKMLEGLQDTMLRELQVPNSSAHSLKELSGRAQNIKGLSDDHVVEAFINRLEGLYQNNDAVESIASLAASKPTSQWIDTDVKTAELRLVELARHFKQLETLAHVKGRVNKRSAMAMVVDLNNPQGPIELEFNVLDSNDEVTEAVSIDLLEKLMVRLNQDSDLALSVLARASEKLAVKRTLLNSKREAQG